MKLQKLFNEYCALDAQGKIAKAQEAYNFLKGNLKVNGHDDKSCDEITWLLIRAAVGADKYASEEEYKLFVAITGKELSLEDFAKFAKGGNKQEFADTLDSFVDNLDSRAKEAALSFVAAFLSVDGKLGEQEKALFANFED